MRRSMCLASIGLLASISLSGCGDETDDYEYDSEWSWYNGHLLVNVGYGTVGSATAMTIEDLPAGDKSFLRADVFRASDLLDSSTDWDTTPIASKVFGSSQTDMEILDLPVDEALIVDITTYDFSGQPTFVGRGQVTLDDGVISRIQVSMRPFGMFLKSIVSPTAKKRATSWDKDRVQWRYEVNNFTLEEQWSADISAEVLNADLTDSKTTTGLSTLDDGFCCSSFPAFGTRISRENIPYIEIPTGFRKAIQLRVTMEFHHAGQSHSTTQTVSFMPDYSGL